jgi:purine-binding chemotaxis protein CheW
MTPATCSSSAKPAAGTAQPARNYGGFRLGGLHLAVPMDALREIVPCDTLVPLRGMAACIAGGIQRGPAVVPVVDLRSALGQPLGSAAGASVLLVAHEGELLGLLAHDVTGVMQGVAVVSDPRSPASRQAGPLINSHLPLGSGNNLRVLSLAAVAALPKASTVPKPAKRPRRLPAWLRAWTHALQFRVPAPAPARSARSAQLSGMWDTVVPGVRG